MNLFEKFDEIYDLLGHDNIEKTFNAFFVYDNTRNSFMIQHKDDSTQRLGTGKIIKILSKYFDFKYNDIDQGVIVTKKTTQFTLSTEPTDLELGEFLSYPCASDFLVNQKYIMDISINGSQIIGMICGEKNTPKQLNFVAELSKTVDKVKKYSTREYILSYKFTKFYTNNDLMRIALSGKFKQADKNAINNELWNYGFAAITNNANINIFDDTNRSLLIFLLSMSRTQIDENMYALREAYTNMFLDFLQENKL